MERRALTEKERRDWLRLFRSRHVGPATFQALLQHAGDISGAIEIAPELSRRGGRKRAISIISETEAEDEIAAAINLGARIIALCEPEYPDALAAIHDPPPVLTVLGDPAKLSGPAIAIIGARNASAAGRRFARDIAAELGQSGLVVASGLARGIDTAAHEGSLATGTVAVLAGGVDVCYPDENRTLYDRIAEGGAIISEQKLGTKPTARHFPPRNRLISGLSLGVVIVEAALRSGSLITARMALEQGREVFAVPGSPGDPRHRGTNRLIRDDAQLTEHAEDVLDTVREMGNRPAGPPNSAAPIARAIETPAEIPDQPDPDSTQAILLELLSHEPVSVDELLRECQLSPAVALSALLELELAGRIERHPGNRVSLV